MLYYLFYGCFFFRKYAFLGAPSFNMQVIYQLQIISFFLPEVVSCWNHMPTQMYVHVA